MKQSLEKHIQKDVLNSSDKLLRRDLFLDGWVFDVRGLIFLFQFEKEWKSSNYVGIVALLAVKIKTSDLSRCYCYEKISSNEKFQFFSPHEEEFNINYVSK